MPKKDLTPQQKWDRKHPDKIKKSKAEYDKKNPVWKFRPSVELREWLEKERCDDKNGKPETNAALLTRKLEKLMEMEYQGY